MSTKANFIVRSLLCSDIDHTWSMILNCLISWSYLNVTYSYYLYYFHTLESGNTLFFKKFQGFVLFYSEEREARNTWKWCTLQIFLLFITTLKQILKADSSTKYNTGNKKFKSNLNWVCLERNKNKTKFSYICSCIRNEFLLAILFHRELKRIFK